MKSSLFLVVVVVAGILGLLGQPASGAAAYLTFQKSTQGDAQLQIDENANMPSIDTTSPPLQLSPDQQAGSSSSNVQPVPQILPDSRSSLTQSSMTDRFQPQDEFVMSGPGFDMKSSQTDSSSMGVQSDDSMSQSGSKKLKTKKSKKSKTSMRQSDNKQDGESDGDDDDEGDSGSAGSSPEEFSLFYKHDEINLVKPDQVNSSSMSKVFMINGVPVDTSDQSPVIQKLNDFVVNLQSVLLTLNQTATAGGPPSEHKVGVGKKPKKSGQEESTMVSLETMEKKKKKKTMKVKKSKKIAVKSSSSDDQSTTALPYSSDGENSDEEERDDDEGGDQE